MRNQKKYLASANTSAGFVNCFNSINPTKNSFCYILKGGPGTGKSSLMKKVANYFEQKGHKIEYFYCSSDEDSLDGIRIKNFSIVDGTAPHVTEASMPGIKEKIINVGEFINDDIKIHKQKIEKLISKKNTCFRLAYKYFSMLKTLTNIQSKLSMEQINSPSKNRTLFASYISPSGFKSFYKQNNYKNVCFIEDNFVKSNVTLKTLEQKLKNENVPFTKFLSVFEPSLSEAIYNPTNKTLYVCKDIYEQKPQLKDKILSNIIIKKISNLLAKAKYYHKQIESFYVPCMDFEGLNKITNKIIAEIDSKVKI